MSENGPFDAAISWLRVPVGLSDEQKETAIRVLEDWPKWKPLIEAAGKVDKKECLACLDCAWCVMFIDLKNKNRVSEGLKPIRALLESLPGKEVEEEPKHYRCESCGKDFDKKLFSHSRTEENMQGEPVEVECGPITEIT